jgi:IclR family acetate operon transcriptional repressor
MRTTRNGTGKGRLASRAPNGGPRAPRHRATDRVIDILELAAESRGGLALKDVSRGVGTPKSSLLPLLRTLTARGYLEQGHAGEYRLGPRAVELGARSRGQRDLAAAARPALEELMRYTGETVFLATLTADGTGIVYVDKVESEQIIRYSSGVGDRRPLHATASGKAILAFLPPARRAELLDSLELVRYTERTLATVPALRASLDEVRRAGVCVNIEEIVRGACGIAAPIFDHRDAVRAACAIGGPTDRVRPRLRELAAAVKATAEAISRRLGWGAEGA